MFKISKIGHPLIYSSTIRAPVGANNQQDKGYVDHYIDVKENREHLDHHHDYHGHDDKIMLILIISKNICSILLIVIVVQMPASATRAL